MTFLKYKKGIKIQNNMANMAQAEEDMIKLEIFFKRLGCKVAPRGKDVEKS